MLSDTERADVRGRQLAWLLVVGPATTVLTVATVAVGRQWWAWPWVFAALPAILGGDAGIMVVLSVAFAVPEKEPQSRAGPLDLTDDADARATVAGQAWATGVGTALTAAPGLALVLLGALRHDPYVQALGVGTGIAVGVALFLAGGRVAARRLTERGATLMDLFLRSPEPKSHQRPRPAWCRAHGRPPGPGRGRALDGRRGVRRAPGPRPARLLDLPCRPDGQGLVRAQGARPSVAGAG